jgi:acetoin utilization protein AcuB
MQQISDRDLGVVENIPGVDTSAITVEDAMTGASYVVLPEAPLATVAAEMAEMKLGSAVVMDGSHVIGVFTTVDALTTLASLLGNR